MDTQLFLLMCGTELAVKYHFDVAYSDDGIGVKKDGLPMLTVGLPANKSCLQVDCMIPTKRVFFKSKINAIIEAFKSEVYSLNHYNGTCVYVQFEDTAGWQRVQELMEEPKQLAARIAEYFDLLDIIYTALEIEGLIDKKYV